MKRKFVHMTLPKGCIVYLSGVPMMIEEDVVVKVCSGKKSEGMVRAAIPFSGKIKGVEFEGLEMLEA